MKSYINMVQSKRAVFINLDFQILLPEWNLQKWQGYERQSEKQTGLTYMTPPTWTPCSAWKITGNNTNNQPTAGTMNAAFAVLFLSWCTFPRIFIKKQPANGNSSPVANLLTARLKYSWKAAGSGLLRTGEASGRHSDEPRACCSQRSHSNRI